MKNNERKKEECDVVFFNIIITLNGDIISTVLMLFFLNKLIKNLLLFIFLTLHFLTVASKLVKEF